jgi:hypothetical protein
VPQDTRLKLVVNADANPGAANMKVRITTTVEICLKEANEWLLG